MGVANLAYYETRSIAGAKPVSAASADPQIPDCLPIPVDTDHFGLAKPRSESSAVYLGVRNFIDHLFLAGSEQWVSSEEEVVHSDWEIQADAFYPNTKFGPNVQLVSGFVTHEIEGFVRRVHESGFLPFHFEEDLFSLVVELANNAFVHGSATVCDVAVYDGAVVVTDDGNEFDPLTYDVAPRGGRLGAGLFQLQHILKRASPEILGEHAYHAPDRDEQRRGLNELLLRVAGRNRVRYRGSSACVINFRGPVSFRAIEHYHLSHFVDIAVPGKRYVLDFDNVKAYIRRLPISGRVTVVDLILSRLPPDAILHLKTRSGDILRAYYQRYNAYDQRLVID